MAVAVTLSANITVIGYNAHRFKTTVGSTNKNMDRTRYRVKILLDTILLQKDCFRYIYSVDLVQKQFY